MLGVLHRRPQIDEARRHLEQAKRSLAEAAGEAEWSEDTYRRNGFAEQVDLSMRPQPPRRGGRKGPKPT